MKNSIYIVMFLLIGNINPLSAQRMGADRLGFGTIKPYQMAVTFDKTSHLIFPSAIRYVDLGSEYLIAGKAEDAENVLRVKAAVRDFEKETNFSVITEDGRFFNFDVYYSPYPRQLNYDLQAMQRFVDKSGNNEVLFEELGGNSPSLAGLLLETIHRKNKRTIKHIGSKSFGIRFALKGLYIHNGKYYFHTELKNNSNVPFWIDFITFKIVDKKVAKRTVVQERSIIPLRMYKPLATVPATSYERNVFLLDQFTIADDKVLLIGIYEKNGSRNQVLEVENADLVNARLVNDMHLKF